MQILCSYIILRFIYTESTENFKKLQYVTFSQLQTLRIINTIPKFELLTKFLEINGKTLSEIYAGEDFISPSLVAFTKFCPNLRKLSINLENNKLETLKTVFNDCQYLESLKIWYKSKIMNESKMLETVVKYSPKSFHEFGFDYVDYIQLVLPKEELETILISWSNRVPLKPLSLIIDEDSFNSLDTEENKKLIDKYIDLGIIKEFKFICF